MSPGVTTIGIPIVTNNEAIPVESGTFIAVKPHGPGCVANISWIRAPYKLQMMIE